MPRPALPLITMLALAVSPVLAAERIPPSSGPERFAFGLFLVGTIAFFVWVAWLARRR